MVALLIPEISAICLRSTLSLFDSRTYLCISSGYQQAGNFTDIVFIGHIGRSLFIDA